MRRLIHRGDMSDLALFFAGLSVWTALLVGIGAGA